MFIAHPNPLAHTLSVASSYCPLAFSYITLLEPKKNPMPPSKLASAAVATASVPGGVLLQVAGLPKVSEKCSAKSSLCPAAIAAAFDPAAIADVGNQWGMSARQVAKHTTQQRGPHSTFHTQYCSL